MRTIVIAAAGRGTRMKHLTEDRPKHLIPIGGKPFFWYLLQLVFSAGFEKVIVVGGYQSSRMEAFLSSFPQSVFFVNQEQVCLGRYGTAVVAETAQPLLNNEPFVFLNGDSLFSVDMLQHLQQQDAYTKIVGTYHPFPQYYGVIESDADGYLQHIVEKPQQPLSHLINVGLYAFQPSVFSVLPAVTPSSRGEYEIVDVVNILARQGTVRVEKLRGDWIDLTTPEDIQRVEQFIQKQHLS